MCTAATYTTDSFYFGRNLDYEFSYGDEVTVTPRAYPFALRCMGDFRTKYAMIGMAYVAGEYPLYYDAVNEKGLGIAGLNFVGNAVYHPAQDGKAGVKDGQAQHKEGDREGNNGVGLEQAINGDSGQNEAQESGAGVPHKDLGGVEVVGQEADAGSGQGGHKQGGVGFGHRKGNDQHGHGADGGYAAGQTVQAVNEVYRVGDAHNPENGDGDRPDAPAPNRGCC